MQRNEGHISAHDGIRLYFGRIGDGREAVIFPNGMYLRDAFTAFAANRSLIFYDVRNRGRSDAVANPANENPPSSKMSPTWKRFATTSVFQKSRSSVIRTWPWSWPSTP